jgi:hypothetical protein
VFLLLVFLHVLTMFVAVACSYGPTAMFLLAIRSNRIERARAVGLAVGPLIKLIPIVFGIGALFGLGAALVVGYNLFAPWLLISYALFGVASAIGAIYGGPFAGRLTQAFGVATEGPFPPAATALVRNRKFLAIQALDFATIVLLILDMVFKPFS